MIYSGKTVMYIVYVSVKCLKAPFQLFFLFVKALPKAFRSRLSL